MILSKLDTGPQGFKAKFYFIEIKLEFNFPMITKL